MPLHRHTGRSMRNHDESSLNIYALHTQLTVDVDDGGDDDGYDVK